LLKRKGIDFLMQNVQRVNLFFDKEVFNISLYCFFELQTKELCVVET